MTISMPGVPVDRNNFKIYIVFKSLKRIFYNTRLLYNTLLSIPYICISIYIIAVFKKTKCILILYIFLNYIIYFKLVSIFASFSISSYV